MCWLSGPAGYGKSAISHAIAEHYDQKGRLIGNFFFFRGAGDRSILGRLVLTLSHQLYHCVQATKRSIENAIKADPHIATKSSTYQFQKLIIEPIRAASNAVPFFAIPFFPVQKKLVIVIDALDECDDKRLMRDFIEAVIRTFQGNHGLPLRVIITSRVEEHIQETLGTPAALSVVHRLSLPDFDARADIRAFFRSRLSTLYHQKHRLMLDVSPPWPSESDLNSLVRKSEGSFLFATTLIDLVGSRGLPQDNLCRALTVEGGLDPLYAQILADAHRDHNFERVIGTVMLLQKSISIVFLAHLLQLRPADIVQTLMGLQSILMIPGGDNEAIRVFHTSLRDFLTSPGRSLDFFVNPSARHLSIAADCLRVITVRPTDDFCYGDREMYACLNWCHHFEQGVTNGVDDLSDLMSCLMDFASKSVDCWVNTSLVEGVKQLQVLRSVISKLRVSLMWYLFCLNSMYDLHTGSTTPAGCSAGCGRY